MFAMNPFDALNSTVIGAFGEPVVYRQTGKADVTVNVVIGEGARMTETEQSPYLHVFLRTADLTTLSPKRGDRILIGHKTYNVVEVEADQQGGATLRVQGRGTV